MTTSASPTRSQLIAATIAGIIGAFLHFKKNQADPTVSTDVTLANAITDGLRVAKVAAPDALAAPAVVDAIKAVDDSVATFAPEIEVLASAEGHPDIAGAVQTAADAVKAAHDEIVAASAAGASKTE